MKENGGRPIHRRAADGLRGLVQSIRRERAVRTQLLLSGAGIAVLAWLQPPLAWVLTFAVLVVLGFAAEALNGALEALLDRLHPEFDAEIGAAKDMASAAPLVIDCATVAAFVGAVLSRL
jgi:diacylglycerol kinase